MGEQKYRGFIIYKNLNEDFGSEYYTVLNVKNQKHVHINKEEAAKKMVDCYWARNRGKYGRRIRNRCLQLEGYDVKF